MQVSEAQFKLMMAIVGFDTPDIDTIVLASKEAANISRNSFEWWLGSSYWLACQGQTADEIGAFIYGVSRHG